MRPRYHYAPASNWLSDPNGLVHHDDEWHLFYQYNPEGEDWGHMSWGHAVSRDLAHWEELPVALRDDDRHMIFSGSAVIDVDNTAGFGRDAMVAIYTGAMTAEPRQVQCLAHSPDKGRNWSLFPGNPVIDLSLADFRDPNVFWHAPSGRWIMVVVLSNCNSALLYASANLREWEQISEISGEAAPGEIWECPLLIELPVEGGGSRWLFKVDVLRGAPGSGAIYQTGSFDGTRFVPDDARTWQVADWGADFYAAIAWHDPRDEQGRPLWIGWMGNHAYQGKLPVKGWRGAMSVPRRIWLRQAGEGYLLCQQMAAEVAGTVPEVLSQDRCSQLAGRRRLAGDAWQVTLGDAAGRTVEVSRQSGTLTMVRRDAHCPELDCEREAALTSDEPVELWADAGSVEIIADGGAIALTMQHGMMDAAIWHYRELALPV